MRAKSHSWTLSMSHANTPPAACQRPQLPGAGSGGAYTGVPPLRHARMLRSRLAEPLVMLATVLQWLVLATFTGAVVGVACSLFLRILFATEGHVYAVPLWLQATLLIGGGLANGVLLHYGYRLSRSGFNDSPI